MTEPLPPRHPDDEQLSAHLDDRAPADVDAHVAGCTACTARLDVLQAVSAAVAAPPRPPSSAETDRAVAAALAAHRDASPAEAGAGRRSWRGPIAVLAAAAVIVGLLVAAPMLTRKRSSTTALAQADARAGASAGAPSLVEGGDLGEQSNAQQLGSLVRSRLTEPNGPGQSATIGPEAASGATDSSSIDCLDAARQVAGPGATPVYSASLRWQGAPAVVLVFPAPTAAGGGLSRQLLVLARSGCAVLVSQRF
jgi:hypothetical protein